MRGRVSGACSISGLYLTESSVGQEVVVYASCPFTGQLVFDRIALLCRVAQQTYGYVCVVRPKTVQDTVVGELITIMNDVNQDSNEPSTQASNG